MSVTLLVRITGKRGHGRALAELLKPVPKDNDIEGCLGMDVYTNTSAPDELLILEHWTSSEAHKTFLSGLIAKGGLDEMMTHADAVTRTYLSELED